MNDTQYIKMTRDDLEKLRNTNSVTDLGIQFETFDLSEEYLRREINYYMTEYHTELNEHYAPYKEFMTEKTFKEFLSSAFVDEIVFFDHNFLPGPHETTAKVKKILSESWFPEKAKAFAAKQN